MLHISDLQLLPDIISSTLLEMTRGNDAKLRHFGTTTQRGARTMDASMRFVFAVSLRNPTRVEGEPQNVQLQGSGEHFGLYSHLPEAFEGGSLALAYFLVDTSSFSSSPRNRHSPRLAPRRPGLKPQSAQAQSQLLDRLHRPLFDHGFAWVASIAWSRCLSTQAFL